MQFGQDELGVAGARHMRIGVGRPGGKVVRLIDDEQRLVWREAGPVEEKPAIVGGKNVVVVADPDIIERQRGPRDLIRAQPRVLPGGPEGLQIVGLILEEVEPGQPAVVPARLEVGEKRTGVAHAVENGIHAVLRFRSHLPRRDGRREVTGGGRLDSGRDR